MALKRLGGNTSLASSPSPQVYWPDFSMTHHERQLRLAFKVGVERADRGL